MRPVKYVAAIGLPVLAVLDAWIPEGSALALPVRIALGLVLLTALVALAHHHSPAWGDFRWKLVALAALAVLGGIQLGLLSSEREALTKLASFLGLADMMLIAFLFSRAPRSISPRTVIAGLVLQIGFGLLILYTGPGKAFFGYLALGFLELKDLSVEGAKMVFGDKLADESFAGFIFAVQGLPVIIFVGALSALLYYFGILQLVVRGMAWVMRRLMRASGAESLATAANVFVGMVEAPLVVRPYVARMTQSELFTVMTAGLATVAGSVMALYAIWVGEGLAAHLICASVMSAPAAIVIAKIMIPETETPETVSSAATLAEEEERPANAIDAVSRGAQQGLKLALNVAATLIVFVAFVALVNALLGLLPGKNPPTLERVFARIFAPVAVLMGVRVEDAGLMGSLLGTKTALNELLAYLRLKAVLAQTPVPLARHSQVIATYALCGFANFGSVGIMIGGVGAMVPTKRGDLARLGMLSLVSGTLGAFMTACAAGTFL